MIKIENTVISFDVITKRFCCNPEKCKGLCCVMGDSGAPLEDDEIELINRFLPEIKKHMRKECVKEIEQNGIYFVDEDQDKVTPLLNRKECVFVIFENGIVKCAIEKAYLKEKTGFRKPLSCHLYPIRLKKYDDFIAVNYHRWDACLPAVQEGKKQNLPLYVFLKEALTRRFGENWYRELESVAEEIKKITNH